SGPRAARLGLLERAPVHQPLPAWRGRGRVPVLSTERPLDGVPVGATAAGRDPRKPRRVSRPPGVGGDRRLSPKRGARPLVHRRRRSTGAPRLSGSRARAGGPRRPLDRRSAKSVTITG